jgi:hypothetical protein
MKKGASMQQRILSILFKSVMIAGCLTGLVLNLLQMKNIVALLSYYTIQSNLVCLALFLFLVIREIRTPSAVRIAGDWPGGPKMSLVKGGCTLSILITFFVYHFMLGPRIAEMAASYRPYSLPDILVHYFSPLMVLLDYFLFDKKGRFKFSYPLVWALMPLSYLLFVPIFTSLGGRFAAGGTVSKYPYFFLNVEKLGIAGVGKYILLIVAGFLLVAYFLIAIDLLLGKISARRQTSRNVNAAGD